jgi:flavin-dependent dehydrogenase
MPYDLIVIGGGVTGSSLAIRVASAGARVLIVERETSFRDTVFAAKPCNRGAWPKLEN